jgi:PPOX class probable F420-dependent enzyme
MVATVTDGPLAQLDDDARALLEGARIARLATADAQGAPHVIPICFAIAGGRIYSVVDEKPKHTTRLARLRNIEANPNVALIIDRYEEDWAQLAWVQLRGNAKVLEGGAGYERGLAALREKYQQYHQMDLAGRPLIEVTPVRVNSWRAS